MNKILTSCVVVGMVGLMAFGGKLFSSSGKQVPANVHETDQQRSYKKTIDFLLSTDVFRAVDLQKGIVWVDDAFLEKTHHNKENALWPVYLHLIGKGESEWFASVEVRHFETDKRVGKFSGGAYSTR